MRHAVPFLSAALLLAVVAVGCDDDEHGGADPGVDAAAGSGGQIGGSGGDVGGSGGETGGSGGEIGGAGGDVGGSGGAIGGAGGDNPGATFAIHYHRADGDYDGWTAEGDLAGAADDFGARYEIPLTEAATLPIQLYGPAGATVFEAPVEIAPGDAPDGVWIFHGQEAPMTRAPAAIPGDGQVAIYYKRGDDAYEGWGLHLWGDVAEETLWTFPAPQGGIDPDFGAYWLVDVAPGGDQINLIVHMGDEKDPGPDMGFSVAELGDIVFLVSGSTDIAPMPVEIPEFSLDGAQAFWIDGDTVALDAVEGATAYELRWDEQAAMAVEGLDIAGGEAVALSPVEGGLTEDQQAQWPHLRNKAAYTLPEGADRDALLRSQLIVVARDDAGAALWATKVQMPGAIDALYGDYEGALGATYGEDLAPSLALWAPTAHAVRLARFDSELAAIGAPLEMTRGEDGVWRITGEAGWYGTYYQYEITVYHPLSDVVVTTRTTDPYAVSLSADGRYVHLISLDDPATKPAGWDALVKPALDAPEDIALYELHIRDFSAWDETVPADHRGKYLAFTHNGFEGADESDGMAHLKGLRAAGLNTIHLLPAFDIATVLERREDRVEITDGFDRLCAFNDAVPAELCDAHGATPIAEVMASYAGDSEMPQQIMGYLRDLDGFNWGYDPLHYTAPEGCYATDPEGAARIVEFRQMVMALAAADLRVVMDVVYNHTNASGLNDKSVLDKIVPGYYHRLNVETGFVETSTCCANTATEHRMMARLMRDSLVTWARDYKVDGFRFDLMGHHMKANMEDVRDALQALTAEADGVHGESIYLYGEGWNFGEVQSNARGVNATQLNMGGTGIGTFNDRIRDAVRGGGPFDSGADLILNQGFINGLFTAPNDHPDHDLDADRAKLLEVSDQIRVGLSGNLKRFRLQTRAGGVSPGSLVGYNGEPTGYTEDPQEVINYISKHDNQTLFDNNAYKAPAGTSMDERVRMHNLGLSLMLFGQGVPFFHAGVDLLRSKSMERDSYDSGDWFNRVDFSGETSNWKVGLPREDQNGDNWPIIRQIFEDESIAPTAAHVAAASAHMRESLSVRFSSVLFRLRTEAQVMTRLDFHNTGPDQIPGLLVMSITDGVCAGEDLDPNHDGVLVMFNSTPEPQSFTLDGAEGFTLHPAQQASADPVVRTAAFADGTFTVPARTTAVFVLPQEGAQGDGLPCNAR